VVQLHAFNGPAIHFSTLLSGVCELTVDLCHLPTGDCKRYAITFEVLRKEDVKPPTAQRDLYAVAYNGQRMLDVLSNDEIIGEVSSIEIESELIGVARFDGLNRLHYTAPTDWCGEELLRYEVCNAGGCDTATVTIQVMCEDLLVFNGFSPNQDGVNDYFTVVGIENYPDNKLVIFNQHGHEVYSATGYNNTWDGTFNQSPVLDGTYYYVLDVKGQATRSGYVQLRR
jgi:gliding motility-associated-like protein